VLVVQQAERHENLDLLVLVLTRHEVHLKLVPEDVGEINLCCEVWCLSLCLEQFSQIVPSNEVVIVEAFVIHLKLSVVPLNGH
jgi:hypothetical protein